MDYVVKITESIQIVLYIPEAVHYIDQGLIEHIMRRDFNFTRRFNVYFLKKNAENNTGIRGSLLRLHSYLEKENIPHRIAVVNEPYSTEQTVKLSCFFWFDSEGVKRVFRYKPYIPSERDFLSDEYMRKMHKAGNNAINYMNALGEYKTHSADSMRTTSKPSQTDLRHLYLGKQFLNT